MRLVIFIIGIIAHQFIYAGASDGLDEKWFIDDKLLLAETYNNSSINKNVTSTPLITSVNKKGKQYKQIESGWLGEFVLTYNNYKLPNTSELREYKFGYTHHFYYHDSELLSHAIFGAVGEYASPGSGEDIGSGTLAEIGYRHYTGPVYVGASIITRNSGTGYSYNIGFSPGTLPYSSKCMSTMWGWLGDVDIGSAGENGLGAGLALLIVIYPLLLITAPCWATVEAFHATYPGSGLEYSGTQGGFDFGILNNIY